MLNLASLDMSSNNLVSFPLGFFQHASGLLELDLTNNKIEALPTEVFAGLQLQNLTLAQNQIHNLTTYPFHNLSNLQLLDLSDNLLNEVCH